MTRSWRWLVRTWRQRFTHDMTFREQLCPCCTRQPRLHLLASKLRTRPERSDR